MPNKMLIDATHPEETRVVVVHGNRVEEFDFESENKKQLRGNIYLAKVTRVEPSLQAAFVEYGGNRHGFLAFSEIHPDYYQIPVADREAILAEQARVQREEEDDDPVDEDRALEGDDVPDEPQEDQDPEDADIAQTEDASDKDEEAGDGQVIAASAETSAQVESDVVEDVVEDETGEAAAEETGAEEIATDTSVESTGSEDAIEEATPRTKRRSFRSYKIQEVIKRRQIILIQVVKEERGNKGAALTTYLSMAGRYCVLMPNTARGGGISRKITSATDRKRLKSVAGSLDVPEGMGLIVRTAGAKRTKAEIKRDYEYLLRLWESVRELTLKSSAPALVYEEGSLIKRSIRDLYNKDIESVQVDGEEGYREAKDFMRMLMPSHAKNVQPYKDGQPLFQKFQVDQQLDGMFNPVVQLKSGGYIVINPTEALVSIDVNSGRATKERNIEATALKTNMEAAEEVARQMRLRDLAGLLVIDFIDMDENRNNRAVERKLKDCLKTDRARIQVGRISHFGLLEMSRQRMRAGILEGSTITCPTCDGIGLIRSVESTALMVLRAVEAEAMKGRHTAFTTKVAAEVALYILNQKRASLLEIEARCGVSVFLEGDNSLRASDFTIEPAAARDTARARPAASAINVESAFEDGDDEEQEEAQETRSREQPEEGKEPRRRRRGGRRRRTEDAKPEGGDVTEAADATKASGEEARETEDADSEEDGDQKTKRRRRGRRGGRRNRRRTEETATTDAGTEPSDAQSSTEDTGDGEAPVLLAYSQDGDIETNGSSTAPIQEVLEPEPSREPVSETVAEPSPEPEPTPEPVPVAEDTSAAPEEDAPTAPARRGWWQRKSG